MAKISADDPRIVAIARQRLLAHMHGLDPTTIASAEMSKAKASGDFHIALETLLRQCVMSFSPDATVQHAVRILGVTGQLG